MQTYADALEYTLLKLIDERIAALKDILAAGSGVPDHEKYCEYVGQIRGLREIKDLCEEASRRMEKD